jgi:hemolysin activation/secretion protein
VLTAQFITSPTNADDVKIFGAGYHAPIYAWSGSVDLFAGYSDVDSGTIQDLFAVSGSGTVFGARYNQILPRIGTYEQKLSFGLDYRDFHQNVNLVNTSASLLPDIIIKPWSIAYSGRLSRVGTDLSFVASFSQNIPGGKDGDQDAFDAQRPEAPARYQVWRLAGAWSRVLPSDFLARAAFSGQYTKDPLVPGEQFGMGGATSVRGFYERESANDRGYRVSAELYGPDFGSRISGGWTARPLAFVDAARGKDVDPARLRETGLGSAGIGLRLSRGRSFSARVDWGSVLNASDARPDNHGMLQFAAAYSF